MTLMQNRNRRLHPRFTTPPMYHAITVRLPEQEQFTLDGHAYNISEGGIQFELDEPIAPGTEIAMMFHLPVGFDIGPGRCIYVMGTVVWISDADEPGPVIMAMSFNLFPRVGDRQRMNDYMGQARLQMAA